MSTLAEFLKAKEPLFDYAVRELEDKTGHMGLDAELAAEIATKSALHMQNLGLPIDCTGQQLYDELIDLVRRHDQHLAHAIGGTNPESIPEMIPLIVDAVGKIDMPRTGLFLKEEVAGQMLTKMPPPNIMQRLGYSDVKQLIIHEDIYELFLSLRFAEEADWLNRFNDTYHSLKATDFEQRTIRLVVFNPEKWGDIAAHFIAKKLHNIANNKEMGAIGVMPMTQTTMTGLALKVMPLMLHYYNELRLYSAFFKLVQNKTNFGEIVATTLVADPAHVKLSVHGHIHWRVIQRYFGKLKHENHPEIFEPHVHPEDLHWRKAEDILYEVAPELEFWKDMDYVAVMRDGEPVTFNLMDVSLSYSNGISYKDRYVYHFRESLWNEVFARYMGQKTLEQQLLVKLDNAIVAPESLRLGI
jgi:hypothetical protein